MKKDCAFQYSKTTGYFKRTDIICDKSGITLDEAKKLWNEYYPDLAKCIKNGDSGEMVIWINMPEEGVYADYLQWIGQGAESDGISIWETIKSTYTKYNV